MPTAAERLSPKSTKEEIQKAISSCIRQMKREHPDWDIDKCIAACYSMARKATKGKHPFLRKS